MCLDLVIICVWGSTWLTSPCAFKKKASSEKGCQQLFMSVCYQREAGWDHLSARRACKQRRATMPALRHKMQPNLIVIWWYAEPGRNILLQRTWLSSHLILMSPFNVVCTMESYSCQMKPIIIWQSVRCFWRPNPEVELREQSFHCFLNFIFKSGFLSWRSQVAVCFSIMLTDNMSTHLNHLKRSKDRQRGWKEHKIRMLTRKSKLKTNFKKSYGFLWPVTFYWARQSFPTSNTNVQK